MEAETLEQMQARHRRELKDLQGRITNKKKNASKKTRKGVNDECAEMERQLREKQAGEVAALEGESRDGAASSGDDKKEGEKTQEQQNGAAPETAVANLQIGRDEDDKQQQQQQQQQPGKKRNRQKERLARRAAEQEAAALRAEHEASSMTDHRARESAYMRGAFAAHGLVEQDIAPDGHCLFAAVADQLRQSGIVIATAATASGGGEPEYRGVRRAAAEYMAAHADDFAPFLEEEEEGGFEGYVRKMRDTAEWGGQLELTALARRYGVVIRVIQDGRTETIGEQQQQQEGDGEGDGEEGKKTLWLAYYRHGYGLGEHYNSLRKAATTTTTTAAAAATG